MGKVKLIPELRFPGFEGEWVDVFLEDISENIMYGMNSAAILFDGENKYIRITDIDEQTREFKPNPLSSPDGIIDLKYQVKHGDILFTRTGASVGKSYLYKETDGNLFFAGFLIRFSIIKNNPVFIFNQTLLSQYNNWVLKMSMRSGQPGINAEEFKSLQIYLTSIEEQTRIATFLTSVDKRISLLTQKKEKLVCYKQGVMQKIFSQELRFKDEDGKDFPEWEEKNLKELVEIIKGQQLNASELTVSGDYPCLNGGVAPSGYTDKFNTEMNTITISEGGNSCGYVNLMTTRFWCGGHCYSLLNLKNTIDREYLFNYLKFIETQIMSLRVGSGLPNIQKKDISMIPIKLPIVSEQQSISRFLSQLNKQVELIDIQINTMKGWKKGLLQKMFV